MHLTCLDYMENGRHKMLSYLVHPQIELKKKSLTERLFLISK